MPQSKPTTNAAVATQTAENDGPCPHCRSMILLGRMPHHLTWCHPQGRAPLTAFRIYEEGGAL